MSLEDLITNQFQTNKNIHTFKDYVFSQKTFENTNLEKYIVKISIYKKGFFKTTNMYQLTITYRADVTCTHDG